MKAEEKRGGGGKGNWGNFEDDVKVRGSPVKHNVPLTEHQNIIQADGDEPTNTSVEESPEGGEQAEPKEKEEKEAAAEEKEAVPEEPKTLTLDEWKAQQAKKDAPKFNVRKAGEGSDIDPKWKKATIYKKENEEESEEEEEESVSLPPPCLASPVLILLPSLGRLPPASQQTEEDHRY